ncbi:MAG: dienelactone hydrolase family protein [Acidimicrobiales bacterium]|jgi:dienelactone hydrolase
MADALDGFEKTRFTALGSTKDIYRMGTGPAVIVMSEMPGITPDVADFGRKVAAVGCTTVMPHLFGDDGRPITGGYVARSMAQACISREFTVLARKKASPVITWLRALAKEEHARCGGPGVGAVGMCFTGGFALAMMVDDVMVAPVLSQPSLPFAISAANRRDLGIPDQDLATVKARTAEGTCLLGLRFTGDKLSPPERFAHLREELGDAFISVELDSSPGNPYGHPKTAHSVLTANLDDRPGTPTSDALDQVLTFFTDRLLA